MFEEALSSAPPPGVDPVTGQLVVWHPELDEWVPVDPFDPAAEIDAVLLAELCTGGSAAVVVDVEDVPVGPELAGLLAGFDPSAASAYELVEAGAGFARLAAWVAGGEAAVLAELVSRAESLSSFLCKESVGSVLEWFRGGG